MRANAIFVLFTILVLPASAFAQYEDSYDEVACNRGNKEACFAYRFGRCANERPRIAIPACTRQLLNRNSVWNDRADSAFINMDNATRYALRGTAHAKLGDTQDAITDYQRAIKAHDGAYWIHGLLGSALFAIGEEREALASINAAVNLAPDNALLLNARSRLLSTALDENVRNGPQAIVDAQSALALEPEQPAFVAALATAYAENGEFDNAIATQRHAIELFDPADPAYADVIAKYRSRLALYREGAPFRREMITCGVDEDASERDVAISSSIFSPVVFCVRNGA